MNCQSDQNLEQMSELCQPIGIHFSKIICCVSGINGDSTDQIQGPLRKFTISTIGVELAERTKTLFFLASPF